MPARAPGLPARSRHTDGTPTILKAGSAHTTAVGARSRRYPARARGLGLSCGRAYRIYALSGNNIRRAPAQGQQRPAHLGGVLPDGSALVLLAANGRRTPGGVEAAARWLAHLRARRGPGRRYRRHVHGFLHRRDHRRVSRRHQDVTIHWLDAQAQRRDDIAVSAPSPASKSEVYGWSIDGSRTLATVESPSDGAGLLPDRLQEPSRRRRRPRPIRGSRACDARRIRARSATRRTTAPGSPPTSPCRPARMRDPGRSSCCRTADRRARLPEPSTG